MTSSPKIIGIGIFAKEPFTSLLGLFVVAVPVGFVKSSESKEALKIFLDNKKDVQIPYIVNIGRKGGSAVAVSIVNALINITKETQTG